MHHLKKSSTALDEEKEEAEANLKRIIRKIVRRRLINRKVRKAWCKLRKAIGKPCHKKLESHRKEGPSFTTHNGQVVKPRVGRFPVWLEEQRAQRGCQLKDRPFPKKLHKAIKRVRQVNKKLVAFERGLISEEGIKDREWYKHLGVAPGKWLGES